MTSSDLIIETQDHICSITFNRPKQHNAFDDTFIAELIAALQHIEADPHIRVVILSANGHSFCAGADMKWMKRMVHYNNLENVNDALQLANLLHLLATLSKPTIALVQGSAYGGGVGIIACCDIVVAHPDATFCFSEVKLGLIPAVISPYVIAAMGARQAKRYFITAETFDAHTAMHLNLISEICDTDLIVRGMTLAQLICNNGPNAINAAKQLVHHTANRPWDEALIHETAKAIAEIRVSEEGQEGLNAFLNKRKPHWMKNV